MATVTQQEVAPLHRYLNITINKEDYLPAFEKTLKDHSKKANIPGFRKGMVPAGLIRKMYGNSLFMDEVLRTVDKEVFKYIENEKLDIFAQPLPVEFNLSQLDVNKPDNYSFTFEVGMKPDFRLPDLASEPVKRYKIEITDEMVNEEVERLRTTYGDTTEPEEVTGDNNILDVTFVETDAEGNETEEGIRKNNSIWVKNFKEEFRQNLTGRKKEDTVQLKLEDAFDEQGKQWLLNNLGLDTATDKHFKMIINKVGLKEPRELNTAFFDQLFPTQNIDSEAGFRDKIKEELQAQWDAESRNQLHHTLYHILIDHTHIDFPVDFFKRWMKTQIQEQQKDQPVTEEQVEEQIPNFLNQMKWSLITEKLIRQNNLFVHNDEIRQFAKYQLLGYMGGTAVLDDEQGWVRDYIDRMMKDKKFVDDASNRIQSQKLFFWVESQVNAVETPISREEFVHMNEEHQHHHH